MNHPQPRPVKHYRPHRKVAAATSRRHKRTTPPRRRTRSPWPALFAAAFCCLLVELAATALFSPRLRVRHVDIVGNTTIPTETIRRRLQLDPSQNLVLLPVTTLEAAVRGLPAVADVRVERVFPTTVRVTVRERVPWASVQTPDGQWRTIDRGFVPFRTALEPEPHLIRIVANNIPSWLAVPGLPLPSRTLTVAQACSQWAERQSDFPLGRVEIDPDGKVCLNRNDDLSVFLGSGDDLSHKLSTLERLLKEATELAQGNGVGYINLYSADAPAVRIGWDVSLLSAAAP